MRINPSPLSKSIPESHEPSPLPSGLRGDYSCAAADYVVAQDMASYAVADHDRWRRLYARQRELLPGRACEVFVRALDRLDADSGVPCIERASSRLAELTGWRLVGVPGLLPERAFFAHLAARRFPVTVWLRQEHEFNYVVEPDIFHDFFGHVPLLGEPVFADIMEGFGQIGLRASERPDELARIGRLYWHTIEFGLIASPSGTRAYGAGLMSSPGELAHCLGPVPEHRVFDAESVMSTAYRIDTYQSSYQVLRDLDELRTALARLSHR